MNADDFRNAVLALGDAAAGRALLERHLFDRYRAIEAMPDLSQRRHLHRAHVLASRELILGLMRSDAAVDSAPALAGRMLALGNHGVSRWMALLRHVQYRYRARVARRVFHHGSCGA